MRVYGPTVSRSSESQCPEQTPPLTCQHASSRRSPFGDSGLDGRWRELKLGSQRAPGFVISKGPGRFRALSPRAMSWHLTHKVALVLASLQAADSDCRQRGGKERETPLLLLGKRRIWGCWGVLCLLTGAEHGDPRYRESRTLSSHVLF